MKHKIYFLLMLAPVLSMAALPQTDTLLTPFPHDLSVALLRSFFPIYDMGGPILMGTLMTLLNLGITSIVGIILGYTIIFATVGSAIDAMAIGQKLNMWSLIRIVMGTVMLIPTYNGFTSLQAFILWMVINGVGLADTIWGSVVELMIDTGGVPLSTQNANYWSDYSTTAGLPRANSSPTLVSSLVLSELCMRLKYYQSASETAVATSSTEGPNSYMIRTNSQCGNSFTGICYGNAVSPVMCGSYPVNNGIENLSSTLFETATLMQNGIDGIFDGLYYQAKSNLTHGNTDAISLNGCDPATTAPSNCPISTYVLSGASNYLTGIAPTRSTASDQLDADQKLAVEAMVQQGWVVAGYYYAQVLGQPQSTPAQKSLTSYYFPYQSSAGVPNVCSNSNAPEMQAYCYLYQQVNTSSSATNVQTNALLTQVIESSSVVNSSPSNPNNMVNDPTINYAVALMINYSVYNISQSFYNGLSDRFLSGLGYVIANVGSTIFTTHTTTSTVSLSAANLMNLSLCSMQAMTGIVIFSSGCNFDAAYAPTSTGPCNLPAVARACSLSNSSNCLTTAVSRGCISQDPSSMGMIGSFYYNQTNAIGQNPLLTVINVGRSLMSSTIDSLWQNAKHGLQLVVDGGIGLMVLKIPIQLTMGMLGSTIMDNGALQPGTFFGLLGLGAISDILDLGYKMLLYQAKFMFESVVLLNALLMGFGAMYSIYFPAVPMIIYTLGVIGWFSVVIEAMIAAPIIAAGVAYPQGGQFLGAAEQGLSLGFSVFLRPSLMVIALYMSSLLAQISMDLTHYSFMYFLAFLLPRANDPSGVLSVLVMFMVSLVYVYLSFEILSHAYTFISILPDRIMRWFLAGSTDVITNVNVSSILSGIKDQAQSAGEQMGRATPSAPSGGIRIPDLGLASAIGQIQKARDANAVEEPDPDTPTHERALGMYYPVNSKENQPVKPLLEMRDAKGNKFLAYEAGTKFERLTLKSFGYQVLHTVTGVDAYNPKSVNYVGRTPPAPPSAAVAPPEEDN